MIFSLRKDYHEVLDRAFERLTIDEERPVVIRSLLRNVYSRKRWGRLAIVLFSTLGMIYQCLTTVGSGRPAIVREFWNLPLLLVSPLLWPFRRSLIFNINHNVCGGLNQEHLIISFLCRVGFRFLLMDGEFALADARNVLKAGILSCPFPAPDMPELDIDNGERFPEIPLQVSIVGDLRGEKVDLHHLVYLLRMLTALENVQVNIGLRGEDTLMLGQSLPLTYHNTSLYDDYTKLLKLSDFVIILAVPGKYFARHSGTIMDAVSFGSIPIVPNFPVFRSQVSNPCRVGCLYSEFADIPILVAREAGNLPAYQKARRKFLLERSNVDLTLKISEV